MKAKHRALVVDDDKMVRLLMREVLEQLSVEVAEAADGAEALRCFQEVHPDLVLLDVQMPVMDGFSVCAKLRALSEGQDTAILMVTSLDDHESIARSYELGATDFLTKPLNWHILSQRLRHLIRSQDAYQALRTSEDRLREAQRIACMGHWELDVATGAVYWSDETYRIHGYPPQSFVVTRETFVQAADPRDRELLNETLHRALTLGEPYGIEHRVRLPDGTERTVRNEGEVIFDNQGGPQYLRGVVQDITEKIRAEARIYRLSYFDQLTGLPRRELFLEHAYRALRRAQRDGTTVAVLHIDLDRFKRVNDSLGHAIGDELINTAAERITLCVRRSDLVAKSEKSDDAYPLARHGADEFLVLLSGLRQPAGAATFARRLQDYVNRPFQSAGHELFLTCSIGIAVYPDDARQVDTLLRNADTALHHAKQAGGNCFRYYETAMNHRALDRLNLEARLNHALARNELTLYFQPQMELATGHIVALEALLRWRLADGTMIPPVEFIPIAEETGLILSIGEWVLHRVCAHLRGWQQQGHAIIPVAVNVSARQFFEPHLVKTVEGALAAVGIAPRYLELELTESIIMRDAAENQRKLQALKDAGLTLAVDDFGTGYSSMSYLKRFPLDTLKIDRSFVRELGTDRNDEAIARAIIALGTSLDLTTIAEGVETPSQQAILKALGCHRIQGYLVSRPLPADKIASFLPPLKAAQFA